MNEGTDGPILRRFDELQKQLRTNQILLEETEKQKKTYKIFYYKNRIEIQN